MARTGERLAKHLITLTLPASPDNSTPPKKGRNSELLAERDKQLLHRYYYYTYIRQHKQEIVVAALQKEFCLTDKRLLAIVYQRVPELKDMFLSKPTLAQLTKKYPHFSWTQPRQ